MLHAEQMKEYTALMGVSEYEDALNFITEACTSTLLALMKKDTIVCLMVDDPDNLGAALVCHFLLTATKSSIKTMK